MTRYLFVLVFFITKLFTSYAQEIHTPAEIIQIMEKSEVMYSLESLEEEIAAPDRSENLNMNFYYRKMEGNTITTLKYDVSNAIEEMFEEAEKRFQEKDFLGARALYLKILGEDPGYFKVMTYIGQTYGIEGDFDKAGEWYDKAIASNYIDYMAHWFLADVYKQKGDLDKAIDEITIAQILNRNNPRIQQSLIDIYQLKKMKYADWVFNPQIKIESEEDMKVSVKFDADWLGYGLVKALWMYEPGYRESMGIEEGTMSSLEEREAFASLVVGFNKKKLKKHEEFKALNLAIEKDMINEFIFFEIFLPKNPFAANQLSEDFVNDIKEYVIEVRVK